MGASIYQSIIPLAGILIGLTGVLLPALIIYLVLDYRQKKNDKLLETVRYLAERGLQVPQALIEPPQTPGANVLGSPLYRAMSLVGVGVGLAMMFYMLGLSFLTGIGGMLICIGVAQLIAIRIESGKDQSTPGA
jgi:asparagine N-glycosylation enzyme membrane subunit Stt3